MKHVYMVILFFNAQLIGMNHSYPSPNLFVQSDSDDSVEFLDLMEDSLFIQKQSHVSIQKQQKKKQLHTIPTLKKRNRKINIQKYKTTFWQSFIHRAASIFSYGKFTIVQEKKSFKLIQFRK